MGMFDNHGKTCWSQSRRWVFDIVMEKSGEVSRGDGCVWYSHSPLRLTSAGFFMTISNTPIASTDFSRFFHDYVKHPSPGLTSAGFSMTIKHTHRLDWLQKVFPWLCQAHTSSNDFSRVFHDYIKHTHRFDWLQQVFSWLFQTHPSPRLTVEAMSVFDIVMGKSAEVSRGDGCVRYCYGKTSWSQSRQCFSMTISNIPIASTDFSRFFHDYLKHTPLQLTSAGFSITMSSTHLFNWLQQVFRSQ
jgi:hypothetical protein